MSAHINTDAGPAILRWLDEKRAAVDDGKPDTYAAWDVAIAGAEAALTAAGYLAPPKDPTP